MNIRSQAERAWEKHYETKKKEIESLVGGDGGTFVILKLCFKYHWVCDKYAKQTKKPKR